MANIKYQITLSIIIVNWNTSDLLQQSLRSFLSSPPPCSLEVIVVDNNSTDDSVVQVKKNFPTVKIICNQENLGFAKANNLAIEQAQGKYILLLNSDTILESPQTLCKMIDFMNKHPETGACGCKLVFPDGSHQVGDAGFKPTPTSIMNYALLLSRIFPHQFKSVFLNSEKIRGVKHVDWISGADFMVRSEILPEVGLLSEENFMFAEDIEWGCRIKSYGYEVAYLADIKIIHLQGASSRKKTNFNFSVLWLENLRLLFKRFNRGCPIIYFDFFMTLSFILRSVLYYSQFLAFRKDESLQRAKKMTHFCKHTLLNFGKPVHSK